jgi:ABC-type uncharacterized transport system involved in gliding motility auxiliary subunit
VKRSLPKVRFSQNIFLGTLWLGAVLTISGLSTRVITDLWTNTAIGLLVLGLLIIAFTLLLRWRFGPPSQYQMSWWRRRSAQSTTNALIATLAVLLILGVINIMAIRYGQQIDWTETRQFSLAPQTKEILRQLPEPLKVWSFSPNPQPDERTLLERFRQLNPEQFQFEFVDPQLQPGLAQKFKVFSTNKVVLEFGDRTKTIDSPLTEAQLTPKMVSLISNIQPTAYFLEGHGEVPLAGGEINFQSAAKALSERNFTVSPLNLVQQAQIPPDADLLIIAGPKRSLVDAEIKLIQAYVKEGGRLLALLDPEFKTGLESFFKNYGITLDNRIIVDVSTSGEFLGLGKAVPVVEKYSNHPIAQDFGQGFSYFPLAQAITIDKSKAEQVTPLLISQERTWAEAEPDSNELNFDPAVDLQGPLTLGVAIESPPNEASKPNHNEPTPRLVVIGDSDFATSGPFEQGINGDIFLNSVSWLADDALNLSIRPKAEIERKLALTPLRFRLLALTAIIILPLIAFTLAGTIWWKRR